MSIHICTPECDGYCYTCNKHEPIPDEYYRICNECFHVFATEDELVKAHNAILAQIREGSNNALPDVIEGVHVVTCPGCIHDF